MYLPSLVARRAKSGVSCDYCLRLLLAMSAAAGHYNPDINLKE
jgi:hypothetical protein